MKTTLWIKWPTILAILTILVVSLSLLIVRAQKPSQTGPVLAVLRAQHAIAKKCTSGGQFLLFPYSKQIARIDATACPDDFFQAWQKYVADVQTLAAIHRANAGKAMFSVGAAILMKSPAPLLNALPENPAEAEISLNTAVADLQSVKHVALHYGIKIAPVKHANREYAEKKLKS